MNFEHFEQRILKIFPKTSDKQLKKGYEMAQKIKNNIENDDNFLLYAARISLLQKQDLIQWRNTLAENGVECTPEEVKIYAEIIKIILECL
jgi:hypothetical protein